MTQTTLGRCAADRADAACTSAEGRIVAEVELGVYNMDIVTLGKTHVVGFLSL